MKRAVLLLLLLLLALAQEEQLTYLHESAIADLPTHKVISAFANQQGEILRKVFSHYAKEQVLQWERANMAAEVVRARVVELVVGRREDLYAELKAFVEERLFAKLDMYLLVASLQKEIRLNPQNYYLTFEVYDLLID